MSKFDPTIQGSAHLFTRYMDDILCECKAGDVDAKLAEANQLHPSLKFTIEREINCEIPFLDMKIMRINNKLESTWYTKPTDTGLIMNYHALAPKKYKRSVISGFVHRIYRVRSSWKHIHNSLEKAKEILVKNQYPPSFFEPIVKDTLQRIIQPEPMDDVEDSDISVTQSDISVESDVRIEYSESEKFRFFVQYRGKNTEEFARSLHKCQAPCKVIMTLRKLKTVTPALKPSIEMLMKSKVVYKITCPRCNACYVGQTSRHLKTRFSEHRNNSGPVKTHFARCDNDLTEDSIEVLACTQKTDAHLITLEALLIKEINPTMNTKDEYRQRTLKIKL